MSEHAPSSSSDSGDPVTVNTGLEALQASPEFRGPVEPIGDHEHAHTNDHFALVYESQEEQFAAAVPFLRQGLDRNERCLYITYENSREEVVTAMREYGIDVDTALKSGQLSIHDEQEIYLRNETFDADETVEFIDAAIEEATEEYEALRMTGEMSSVLEEDPECEELVKCEAKANYLFDDVDGLALCQYNRNRFPAEVIRDVINTHPLLIHNGRVSHNVYYTPPEEFFGPQRPSREVDRLLGSLQEQTDTKAQLHQREQYLRASYEITAGPTLDFKEKLEQLLDLGRDRFDLDLGGVATVDPDADRVEVEHVSGDHESYKPGLKFPLSETFCALTVEADDQVSIVDSTAARYDDRRVSSEYGFETYLGTVLKIEGGSDRALFFMSEESRETEFSEPERTFLDLMGQWITYELERQQRERFLRESHTITADSDRDFEAKLEDLLDLGREWMNLDAAGVTHLPSWDDRFLNEIAIGYGDGAADASGELWTDPSDGCYCRQVIESDQPVGMADIRGTDWEDDEIHREHGLTCYLGTKVTNGSTPYGTLWVGSTEARDREFTETERTFLDLIGQWASYEIERDHREQELKESNERLERFAYAASHDLQEPLRMVSSYLQLLETQYADAFDEDGEEYLEFAVDGADRMREMIDGLLQYSRVETRGDPFDQVELDAVLDDVLEDLQFQIEETDAEITAEELPRVEGDGNQLRQVFQNLLENAITYSGSSSPSVHIDAKRRKREWVISIHDNGIGIDPDNQDRIFDIFDRLHTRDEYEGTGLGLALCQRIVERHNGEIRVGSEPDEGSTFSFTLPAVADN